MGLEAYKAMLERHAKERAELEKNLESTRDSRARAAAWAEKVQPSAPRPTWAAKDSPTPSEADIARHNHNIAIKDRQELAALDQRNAAEKARHDQEPPQQFNSIAEEQGQKIDTRRLQFPEDQQPKPQPPAPGSQTEPKKSGLQFSEDVNPKPDPNHHIKR